MMTNASRAAVLMDNAAYFAAVAAAIRNARRSIWILGWLFNPHTVLEPMHSDCSIADLLKRRAREEPQLSIRVLIWKASLAVALAKDLMPYRALFSFRGGDIDFRLDASPPRGACAHQKLVTIDDEVAFCSGADFSTERWDRPDHAGKDPVRDSLRKGGAPPRHSMSIMVEGDTAARLAAEARERWRLATGEEVAASPPSQHRGSCWPTWLRPNFGPAALRITRTIPAVDDAPAVRENEALYLDMISRANELIYVENQYFTSPAVCDALIERLQERSGPEVVLITGRSAPSYFDAAVMDPIRDTLFRRLSSADTFGRFRALAPYSADGTPIVVHSKLMIVDDCCLRIGSANLSSRSFGYDTECDTTIELDEADPGTQEIALLRMRLIAHFLGCDPQRVKRTCEREGMVAAIDALNCEGARLRPFPAEKPSILDRFISRYCIGDPCSVEDAWRPWRRRRLEDAS